MRSLIITLVILNFHDVAGEPQPATPQEAEAHFSAGRWAEARNAYDGLRKAATNRHDAALAIERGVHCALQLGEWDDALERVTGVYKEEIRHQPHERNRWHHWNAKEQEAKETVRRIRQLELARRLGGTLAAALAKEQALATPKRQERLRDLRIDVAFGIVDQLLGDGFSLEHFEGRDNDWWWAARDPWETEEEERDNWWLHVGVPLGAGGQPRFVQPAAAYRPEAGPGERVLYLLNEVKELDVSATKESAARALLKRALIARRLYGPSSEPGWQGAAFYYDFDARPSFYASYRGGKNLKPFWELGDDEARTLVSGDVRALKLPPSENPLALSRQLERDFPRSSLIPEAIYLRGVYYQSRQQFAKAIGEFEDLRKRFPDHERARDAQAKIAKINTPTLLFGQTTSFPPGARPSLTLAHRNVDKVEFTARPVALGNYVEEVLVKKRKNEYWRFGFDEFWSNYHFGGWNDQGKEVRQTYLSDKVIKWTADLKRSDHVATDKATAELKEVGTYVVQARVPETNVQTEAIVAISDVALVAKTLEDKVLVYVADAITGLPAPNQVVYVSSGEKLTSVAAGIVTIKAQGHQPAAICVSPKGGVAMTGFDANRHNSESRQSAAYIITDRPAYRPGSTVQFRIWMRSLDNRCYEPPQPDRPIRVVVNGPTHDVVKEFELRTDMHGCATGSFAIHSEAALGFYQIQIPSDQYQHNWTSFRVEAFKKPEFEVNADGATGTGGKTYCRLQARYYSGEPVRGGRARYTISVFPSDAGAVVAQPFDWLYGSGYGQIEHDYVWLRPSMQAPRWEGDDDWRYSWRNDSGGGVEYGRGEIILDDKGQALVEIDEARVRSLAPADYHRLRIEVEVRDQSRRTVTGHGEMRVGRQQLAASVELDRNWYVPNANATAQVVVLTTTGQGTSISGQLELARVVYEGANYERHRFDVVHTWPVRTDADGRTRVDFTFPGAGFYRLRYQARQDGQDVAAMRWVWVNGPGFDAKKHRFPDLEIIPERRTYAPGDVARLLVLVQQPRARVLWCDDVRPNWLNGLRFVDIQEHASVLEMPVQARHIPNSFVQATVVSNGLVHEQTCALHIPPVQDVLQVKIETDKRDYQPGDHGRVTVRVTDANGKPVTGQVTLTAYDKALTYVQPESGPGPRTLIARRKREHPDYSYAGYWGKLRFSGHGKCVCPEFEIYDDGRPGVGMIGGAPPTGGDPSGGGVDRGLVRRMAGAEPPPLVEPAVRANFSDSAVWRAALDLGPDGTATTEFRWPDALTTWRIRAYVITPTTQVGEATLEVVSSKPLLVRLQTPRFLVASDQAVLSTLVQNQLAEGKEVTAELLVPVALLRPAQQVAAEGGVVRLTQRAKVTANGSHRFDWPVTAHAAGLARVTGRALTDAASDAMELPLPILPYGVERQIARPGFFKATEEGSRTLEFTLPDQIDGDSPRLDVSVSPSVVGPMLEALPYLIEYPYGCTEQTMSRFYPSIITAETLKKFGTSLEAIAKLESKRPVRDRKVIASDELRRVVEAGLERLYKFQHKDHGWGWWEHDESDPFMTAYVLLGLTAAQRAGYPVRMEVVENGFGYLAHGVAFSSERGRWPTMSAGVDLQTQAYVAYVLHGAIPSERARTTYLEGDYRDKIIKHVDALHGRRAQMTPYGLALLALTHHHRHDATRAKEVLQMLLANVRKDDEQGTAAVPTPQDRYWFWWQNDVETNAWCLRALLAIAPEHDLAAPLARWLILHRQSGHHWRSTRDSAFAIAALADYVSAQKPVADQRVPVELDGQLVEEFVIAKENFLTGHRSLTLSGKRLTPGQHFVKLTKAGKGELNFAAQLRFLSQERPVPPERHGMSITRQYASVDRDGRVGEPTNGPWNAGDQVEVTLTVKADNDYDYLAIEDPRPAGMEPVEVQSGGRYFGGSWVQFEIRDDKVVLFVPYLRRGEHTFRYRLRVETPGQFFASPARGFLMYAPEIRALSASGNVVFREAP